ncbi:MAG: hypothetical protein DMF79_07225, partial [Acidobacteria bacterium]
MVAELAEGTAENPPRREVQSQDVRLVGQPLRGPEQRDERPRGARRREREPGQGPAPPAPPFSGAFARPQEEGRQGEEGQGRFHAQDGSGAHGPRERAHFRTPPPPGL